MELSVMSPVLNKMGMEDALKYLSSLGVDSIELGAGGYPGKKHLNPREYIDNPEKVQWLRDLLKKYNIKISAIACHGNPVHPNKETAARFHNEFVDAMKVAALLGGGHDGWLFGMPRRFGDVEESQLGYLCLAAGVSGNAGLAVERGAYPLLERNGEAGKRDRHKENRL